METPRIFKAIAAWANHVQCDELKYTYRKGKAVSAVYCVRTKYHFGSCNDTHGNTMIPNVDHEGRSL
jgi:hypothetical protein